MKYARLAVMSIIVALLAVSLLFALSCNSAGNSAMTAQPARETWESSPNDWAAAPPAPSTPPGQPYGGTGGTPTGQAYERGSELNSMPDPGSRNEARARAATPAARGHGSTRDFADARGRFDGQNMIDPQAPEFAQREQPFDLNRPTFRAEGELWIIERRKPSRSLDDATPGCGSMLTIDQDRQVPLPLKHTDVRAQVHGPIASVRVTQQFHNPFSSKIEAVYAFPLPDNAAINEFVMTIGSRTIRGIIREREEAHRLYNEAKRQGYVASLLTQERPNIFIQSVANIEPGTQIDVSIRYFNTLTYSDGGFEFVFPMTIGPRFNPPYTTDGIAAAPRGTDPRTTGQDTTITYLAPNERSGHDIDLSIDIDAGVNIESISSPTHAVDIRRRDDQSAVVTLNRFDRIPNRDLVLKINVAGDEVKSTLLTHRDDRGSFFTLMLVPPRQLQHLSRSPIEFILVLDRSGSMMGRPLEQAVLASKQALDRLGPSDSFQIVDFSESASTFGPYTLPTTSANLAAAHRYLDNLQAGGGTMMLQGMQTALGFPRDPSRLRVVAFLTDGFIGNEGDVLRALTDRLGDARVFSFGVGTAPNRHLLNRMAVLGRGAVAHLVSEDDPREVMDQFFDRIAHPALTNITLTADASTHLDLAPNRIPDLFAGRPVIIAGRYEGDLRNVEVRGRTPTRDLSLVVDARRGDRETREALPYLWARARITELSDLALYEPSSRLSARVRDTALHFGLLSQFTSFLAIDSLTRTAGTQGTTVHQALPVPEGVRYDTTVGP